MNSFEAYEDEGGVTVVCVLTDGRSGRVNIVPCEDRDWGDPYCVDCVLDACGDAQLVAEEQDEPAPDMMLLGRIQRDELLECGDL